MGGLNLSKRYLVLDPSFRAFGWAVMTLEFELIAYGCIKTEKELTIGVLSDQHRMEKLASELKKVVDEYSIQAIVSEIPFGTQSASATRALYICRGLVYTFAFLLGLPLATIDPAAAKISLTGNYFADKVDMINAVQLRYPKIAALLSKEPLYLRETISDCVGILLAFTSGETYESRDRTNSPRKRKRRGSKKVRSKRTGS